MDIDEVRRLYDRHERERASVPGYKRVRTARTVRLMGPTGDDNCVVWSELGEANADAAIEAEKAYFADRGQAFEWKLYGHDRPADLGDRLAARGFERGDEESVLVLDLDSVELPAGCEASEIGKPVPGTDIVVERILDPAGLGDAISISDGAFGGDSGPRFAGIAACMRDYPDYIGMYVARAAGVAASCARAVFPPGSPFASLWGGATLPEYRNRGLYTALLWARIAEAKKRCYRYITIDAMPTSRPIAERRGFRLLSPTWPCRFGD